MTTESTYNIAVLISNRAKCSSQCPSYTFNGCFGDGYPITCKVFGYKHIGWHGTATRCDECLKSTDEIKLKEKKKDGKRKI